MASALSPTAFSLVVKPQVPSSLNYSKITDHNQYGEPLVPFWSFATVVNGYNILHPAPLASPSLGGVPNRDTLYSVAVYDLAQEDLVITVPNVEDRYYDVSFFDP